MKKAFCMFVLLINMVSVYAYNIIIEDSRIKKDEMYEAIKKWALTTLESEDISILYEDKSNGDVIIKGKYMDKHNGMASSIMHYVLPYVTYQLEIQCDSGSVTAEFIKLQYSYKSLNKSTYTLTDKMRRMLINEHEAILHVMKKYGADFEINEEIEQEYNKMKPLIDEARQKKDDKSLSSKERRGYKSFYDANEGLYDVYSSAHWAEYYIKEEIYNKEVTGLRYYVNSYLDKNY